MIGAYKQFNQKIHDVCDPPSRMAVKKWVELNWNFDVNDFEKYKVDLVCSKNGLNVGYIEIEVRQWFTGLPIKYPTIHIPSRKTKLFNNDLPTIYFVVSGDFEHGMWIDTNEILKHNQVEVKNTAISEGEYFYDVPTDKFKYVQLKSDSTHMNANEIFFRDLERGKAVEEKVLKLIKRKYPCACIIDGFKGYDIWIPEIHKSVEVKYDPMSNDTGNMFIEIEFNNKASALITTTADYWVLHDDHKYIMMTPMQIMNCIFINKLVHVNFVGKGDTKDKKGFLIPKETLFKHGKEMK